MKELYLREMEVVEGGNFVDGFCAGVGIASLFTVVATPVAVGCAAWGVYRLF
ncbi:MAG: hypothetical protein OXH57_03500 [Ekhidna sp.]|nr:hypothetical protein [Ekhidna sp.]